MSHLLATLNEQQQRAVRATEGPVLILAGAGSGKTQTLTHRLAYLLEQRKATPSEVMAVTFTNKAARAMKERVVRLLNGRAPVPPAIGTFHSLGARMLRTHHRYTNRSAAFSIVDTNDSEQLVKRAMASAAISPRQWSPALVRHEISQAKNQGLPPAAVDARATSLLETVVARCYREYEKLLARSDAYDFDDLIASVITLLQNHEEVRALYQQRWRYVSVDEYQDTNGAQDRLLRLLLNPMKNLCVVGDDCQAIYSWRGANVDHILQFERQFPGCQTIYLTQNYRSTPSILTAANQVIAANTAQKHKELWTDKRVGPPVQVVVLPSDYTEAAWVCRQIEDHAAAGGSLADCVVLYRTNAQSRLLEEQFLQHTLPYTIVGGFRFYDRREVKDSLALLQWWVNPHGSVALRRLSSVLLPGIGPKTLDRLEAAAQATGIPLRELVMAGKLLTARARASFARLVSAYQQATQQPFATVAELLAYLIEHSGYAAVVRAQRDRAERWENIAELLNVAALHTDALAFVEEVALVSDLDDVDEQAARVTCMTLHAAKGLEFPRVFIIGCEEGLLPHQSSFNQPPALEEERRLLYVGMTRAQEQLILTRAATRAVRGDVVPQLPSRFLEQLPDTVHQVPDALPAQGSWLTTIGGTAPTSTEVAVSTLEPGHVVTHPTFGRGVVIQTVGSVATCVFPTYGVKTIDSNAIIFNV